MVESREIEFNQVGRIIIWRTSFLARLSLLEAFSQTQKPIAANWGQLRQTNSYEQQTTSSHQLPVVEQEEQKTK